MKIFLKFTFFIFLVLPSCQTETPESYNMVKVLLDISPADEIMEVGSKALQPNIPDVENYIYDIHVIQYSERGVFLTTGHYRQGQAGAMIVKDLEVSLVEAKNSTICLLVNNGAYDELWPDNILSYRELLVPVAVGSGSDRTMMQGYLIGDVYDGMHLNIGLGRMMTRLNVVINNKTGSDIADLDVSLSNVPYMAYAYPAAESILPPEAYAQDGLLYDNDISLPAENSVTLYYYMAPNLCEDIDYVTMLNVSADGRSGILQLSTDKPSAEGAAADLKLYPNNNYTFTVNLK